MVNGANDCYLSAALSEIALAEQSRLGKDCPFTVIATCSEDEVHHKAAVPEERESLAGQISRRTSTWARRIHQCHKFLVNRGKKLQGCDLTPAASRYLIFEDFDDEDIEDGVTTFNQGPRKQFESVLLQCLTRKLPSIAIQTHVVDAGLAHLVELASRNIPVLLLDTVERAITTQRDFLRGQKPFTQLAREADSFPVITRERLEAITIDDDDGVTLDGRNELLDIAMELIERKWAVQIKHGVVDVLDASLVAFLHSTLQLGARVTSKNTGEKVRCLPRIIRCLLASHIYSTVLCSMLLLLLAVSPPPPPPFPCPPHYHHHHHHHHYHHHPEPLRAHRGNGEAGKDQQRLTQSTSTPRTRDKSHSVHSDTQFCTRQKGTACTCGEMAILTHTRRRPFNALRHTVSRAAGNGM